MGTVAAYPERDSWKKLTSSFSDGYGREGHNFVAGRQTRSTRGPVQPYVLVE